MSAIQIDNELMKRVLCATFSVYCEGQLECIRLDVILGPAAPRIHTPARYNLGVQNMKRPYRNENTCFYYCSKRWM